MLRVTSISVAIATALLCLTRDGRAQTASCPVHPLSSAHNITSAISETEAYLTCLQKVTKVPGLAVAIVYRDQIMLLKGYGVRKAGGSEPVDENTVFELASLSKPISSSVIASVAGTGDVTWNSPVSLLDPAFRLTDPKVTSQLTLRDLFSHRSGLPGHVGDSLEELGYTRPEILHKLSLVPLTGTFRQTYAYTNMGLTEGGVAVAKSQGKTWEDLASERIFSRMKMLHTSYRFSDYENAENKAGLHVFENGQPVNRYVREADAEAPAGGASSNVADLAQWLRMQLGGGAWNGKQIVDKQALSATHEPIICTANVPSGQPCPAVAGSTSYYGLGWDVSLDATTGVKTLSHSGAFLLGTSTTVRMLPSQDVGIVVLANTQPIGVPEAISLTFMDLFQYGKLRQIGQRDWYPVVHPIFQGMIEAQVASTDYSAAPPPASPSPAQRLSTYVGSYYNPYYGLVQFKTEHDTLVMLLPPRGQYMSLEHWDADTFTYYFAGESSSIGRRGVQFRGNTVVLQALAQKDDSGRVYQDGVFVRIPDRQKSN